MNLKCALGSRIKKEEKGKYIMKRYDKLHICFFKKKTMK